ncbi:high-affinity nicotinic acid transporter [Phyllosticta citrichinensis]
MTGDSKSADVENFHTEKVDYSYQQTASPNGITKEDLDFLNNFPDEKRKKILRKVDLRLMPMLTLLYLVAYIDKTNIGNARIEGMTEDLHLRGLEYSNVVAIFFIPFILCEVPSNMILYKFARPSIYIGSIVLAWGTIMTLTGVVQSYAGLLAIRFLLGIFEAGFLPGAILIISNWYLPSETQVRIALLYTSAATGGAFSFAIANMSGVAGLRGWRWIFIIEGIFTVAVAVMCFFLLCDTPALSSGRRAQMPSDCKESDGSHFNLKIFKDMLFNYKIYLLTFASWSNAVPNYAMKFTMPSILTGMGYANSAAQLMTTPPYAIGAVSAFGFAIFADRTSWRYPFLVGPQLCIITAFIILFAKSGDIKDNVAACYFAVCLACFGMYPVLPSVNAWNVANTPDPAKRSVSIGLLMCMGNVGGLVGSYIYLDKEAPRYPTGYGTSLAFGGAGIVAASCLELLLRRANRKKAAMSEEEIHRAFTAEELRRMGEKIPLFKYALREKIAANG